MKRQQSVKAKAVTEGEKVIITIKEDLQEDDLEKVTNTATPQRKSMHLLDAHIIFEPLLSSLGLMPQQIQNLSLKNLGSNVSILGSIDEVKIDIIESEFGKRVWSAKSGRTENDPSPAFLCEKVSLQIDFKKVTDINIAKNKENVVPLYMTRAQLKRHTSSLVNFSIDVHFISQKVNMPLLRLVNQIATMHQNFKETNEELKEKRPAPPEHKSKEYMRHKKSSSGSSTSSNMSAHLRQGGEVFPHHTNAPSFPTATTSTSAGQQACLSENRLSDSSSRRNFQTPSPSLVLKSQLRNRPKSFAQKFRPNSRLAGMTGGYNALESPITEQHDSFILTSAPLEMITEEHTMIPCWKTMYNLLELYSTMPTTKTVQRQSLTPVSNPSTTMETSLTTNPSRTGMRRTTTPVNSFRDPTKTPEIEVPRVNTPKEAPKR